MNLDFKPDSPMHSFQNQPLQPRGRFEERSFLSPFKKNWFKREEKVQKKFTATHKNFNPSEKIKYHFHTKDFTNAEKSAINDFMVTYYDYQKEYSHKKNSPLMFAVLNQNFDFVRLLIKAKFDLCLSDNEGNTPLSMAACLGDLDMVKVLVEEGGNPVNPEVYSVKSPLCQAIISDSLEVVDYILQKGSTLNQHSVANQALHYIHSYRMAKMLLAAGANVDSKNERGNTLLLEAAGNCDITLIKLLLSFKADPNLANNKGDAPLHIAAFKGYSEVVDILLAGPVNLEQVNVEGFNPLMLAVGRNHPKVVEQLLSKGSDVNFTQEEFKSTPHIFAALKGYVEVLNLISPFVANPNPILKNGLPLLFHIRANRLPHFREITRIINNNLGLLSYPAKNQVWEIKMTKQLAQSFGLGNEKALISWEGFAARGSARLISKSLVRFSKEFSDILDPFTIASLVDGLEFCIKATNKSKDYLQRMEEGKLTFVLSGFLGHSVVILFSENKMHAKKVTVCNTGAFSLRSLVMGEYNSIDLKTVQKIRNLSNREEPHFKKAFYDQGLDSLFYKKIGFKETLEDAAVEIRASVPMQTVGNCSYASLMGAIKSVLEAEHKNLTAYENMELFLQIELLENYFKKTHIKNKYSLICSGIVEQSINILVNKRDHLSKAIDPRIKDKLERFLSAHEDNKDIK